MKRARSGQSLVELAFALLILVVVIGVPGAVLTASNGAVGTSVSTTELDQAARRSLATIAQHLSASGRNGVVDPNPIVAGAPLTGVTFRRLVGLDEGAPIWGPNERINLGVEPGEVLDGADNDSDGLVDEGRVVWTPDTSVPTRIVVLATDVAMTVPGEVLGNGGDENGNGLVDERGFVIRFGADSIELLLALERSGPGGRLYEQVATRSVALRN